MISFINKFRNAQHKVYSRQKGKFTIHKNTIDTNLYQKSNFRKTNQNRGCGFTKTDFKKQRDSGIENEPGVKAFIPCYETVWRLITESGIRDRSVSIVDSAARRSGKGMVVGGRGLIHDHNVSTATLFPRRSPA